MRTIGGLCLALLLTLLHSLEVNAQASLEQTEQWISEKLNSYGYCGEGVANRYTVTFGHHEGVLKGFMEDYMSVGLSEDAPFVGHSTCVTTIHIPAISYVSFTPHETTIWLNLVLKNTDNKSLDTCDDIEDHVYSFILRKSFEDDELPNRMRKAFSRLVELNGGKLGTGEPY